MDTSSAGLVTAVAVGRHHAGGNRLLGLGAALEQAALDQQAVDAHALCH